MWTARHRAVCFTLRLHSRTLLTGMVALLGAASLLLAPALLVSVALLSGLGPAGKLQRRTRP